MTENGILGIPRVMLGRSGILSTKLGLGCAVWPQQQPYRTVVDVFSTAFDLGIRHIDAAALYGTEEIVGRAIQDVVPPSDLVMVSKACSEASRGRHVLDYSDRKVYASVKRSLQRLRVDHLDILHIHDCLPEHLPVIFARKGALQAMLKLKNDGVIRSIGMATSSLTCLKAAIECGEVDHIQPFHTCTLLNRHALDEVIPMARQKDLSVLNNAPYGGYILLTGRIPDARYNYRPASSIAIEAVQRIEEVCLRKGVTLATAALAYSLMNPVISATVIGASTPTKLRERVAAMHTSLQPTDFAEMIAAAGSSIPISTV